MGEGLWENGMDWVGEEYEIWFGTNYLGGKDDIAWLEDCLVAGCRVIKQIRIILRGKEAGGGSLSFPPTLSLILVSHPSHSLFILLPDPICHHSGAFLCSPLQDFLNEASLELSVSLIFEWCQSHPFLFSVTQKHTLPYKYFCETSDQWSREISLLKKVNLAMNREGVASRF